MSEAEDDAMAANDFDDDENVNSETNTCKPIKSPWEPIELTEADKAEMAAHDAQRNRDMDAISDAIDVKKSYGLSVEILYWAMDELKLHPEMTIEEAIGYGFCEWVK